MDPPTPRRPELPSPQRLATTQTALPFQNQDAMSSESLIETLYSHPDVKIISFNASGRGSNRRQDSSTGCAFDEEPGSLSWSSHLERTIAVGPVKIYRAPGSVAFLSCGSALQPMLPKSQCWCVDEMGSKFVLQIRRPQYWRIELPVSNPEEQSMSQSFGEVLDHILQFEKTQCPFQRPFTVELPEQPDTPARKKPWTPAPSLQGVSQQSGSSLTKSRPENSTPTGENEMVDSSVLLGLQESELISDSHPPLYEDSAGARDMNAAASPRQSQSYISHDRAEDTTFASFGIYGSFVGRTGLPAGRIAMLRDIFEKLFSIPTESHFHVSRSPHEAGFSITPDAESTPPNPTGSSSTTGLLVASPNAYDVATLEPQFWMLHQGPWRLSAWMDNRLRRVAEMNLRHSATMLPESILTTPPLSSTDVSALSLPRDVASSLVAASPIESQYSLHDVSLWHSPATPLPPSPPMSRPESPSIRFHSCEEVNPIQRLTRDAEGNTMTNYRELCSVRTNDNGECVVLEDDVGTSTEEAGGRREMEHQDSRESISVQHAMSSLLSKVLVTSSMSEQPQIEVSELDPIRKRPMAIIMKLSDILLSLPSHLIRLIIEVAVKLTSRGWRGRVFDNNHEQISVQWESLSNASSAMSVGDHPAIGIGSGQQSWDYLQDSQIWDVD